ncbi:MAG: carbohydrate binding domain-containing protein [Clostridia bacterium]|nr:carbohydrate binding domain-containing protein [Clostridia bacterium]
MFKRISCFILLIVMIVTMASTGIVSLAETSELIETDLLFNGDMEWLGTSYSMWSGLHIPETENIHGGLKSLKLTSTEENERQLYVQTIDGFVPGQEYTVSCWIYTDDLVNGINIWKNAYAGMKVEIQGTSQAISLSLYPNRGTLPYGEWTYGEATFTCVQGATGTASIHVRHDGIGTVYYDDLKIVGNTTAEKYAEIADKKERYQEGYNISMDFYNKQNNNADTASFAENSLNLIKNPGVDTIANNSSLARYENNEYYIINSKGLEEKVTGAQNWGTRSNYMSQQKDYPEFADKNITEADYEVIYRDDTVYHNGEASVKVHQPTGYVAYNDPYTMQVVYSGANNCGEDFIPGADYLLTAWVKTEDIASKTGGAYFKIQANGTNTVSFSTVPARYTDGQWHQIRYLFTMPEGTTSLYVYARISGAGTVWYDDLALGRADSNPYLDFGTKHTFYYTDEPEIEAWANFKTDVYDIEDGSTVKFTIFDENENTVATQSYATAETNRWTFASSLLATEKAKYIIQAEYILSDGTVKNALRKNIYRYDRPTSMDTEGNIYDTVTGEFIPPVFIYGATYDTHGDLAEAGFTVLRTSINLSSDESIQQHLDDAHAKGVKVLVALYGTVAGHPKQIVRTREVVTKFHTHPAVAAWMLMDEPNLHVSPLSIQTYDEMLYYLEEGYKAVREIDDVHPVYNIETLGQTGDSYERTSQMCDIFAIDPYPGSLHSSIAGYTYTLTNRAINAVYGERPVWVLGLAADWSDYGKPIDSAMLRYQVYEALWTGAKGAGHYLSDSTTYPEPTFTSIYLETFRKSKESGELDEIFDHYSAGNSPTWAEGAGNGYEWQSWHKDNGDIYLAIRSRIGKEGNKEVVIDSLTTDIKLVSSNGKVSIDGYDATLVNGVSEETITSSDNTVAITLKAGEVSLYKVTPAENVNFAYDGDGVPVAYGDEIIANGDCESANPSGFAGVNTGLLGSTSVTNTADPKNSDNKTMKIAKKSSLFGGSSNHTYQNTSLTLESGANYKLSFDMYGESFTSSKLPVVTMTYNNDGATSETVTLYNSHINLSTWTKYDLIFKVPADATGATLAFTFPNGTTTYLDNISLKKVLAVSEHELLKNTSFEFFEANSSYTAANGTRPTGGWATNSSGYSTFTVPAISAVTPHSGNHTIGLGANGTELVASGIPVDYGKTYELSVWFNAKNLTDASTYPQLFVQTSGNSTYNSSLGHSTMRTNFTDAYTHKNDGWYKLSATFSTPEYQEGYDVTKASVSIKMMGSSANVVGYVDDISFRVKPEKTGYTLRNLSYSSNDTAITVEYDVTNHFTESGGTVFYIFYDADGRYVKMEKEDAVFNNIHMSRTFDKIDFTSMKVFIWDSLGGMIPYSNAIE